MTIDEYLIKILESQTLDDDSEEMKTLRQRRDQVEKVLRKKYPSPGPVIRYAGSKAKGTLIKESYDLDLACYFRHDDNSAGDTLEEIYHDVRETLEAEYLVEPKTSSLRVKGKGADDYGADFHIDVVPGRFVDDSEADCFIFQNAGEKKRLKTNLDTHVAHIRKSGVTDAIKLLKLWKVRRHLLIRQFPFELLIIDLLKTKKDKKLSFQLEYFWQSIVDAKDPILVEDPANPKGNDLSQFINVAWPNLKSESRYALSQIKAKGWESIFGMVEEKEDAAGRLHRLETAASVITSASKPWLPRKA